MRELPSGTAGARNARLAKVGGRDPDGWRWWIIVAAIVFVAATVGVVAALVLGDIGLGITIGVAVLSMIMRDIQRR